MLGSNLTPPCPRPKLFMAASQFQFGANMTHRHAVLTQQPNSAEGDRRAAGRAKKRLRVSWRLLGEKHNCMTSGEIHNLSRTGLALHLDAPVPPASVLVVKLEEQIPGLEEPFLVRTKHVTRQKEGRWLAGCSFTRPFNEAAFAILLRFNN